MGDVGADREIEQHAGKVRARADAGGAELRGAHIGLQVGDEPLEVVGRQALARDQRTRRFRHQADRLEVGDRVVERLLIERLIVGLGAGIADENRVAVGRRLCDALAAGHAGRGSDVLHDDRLPQQLAHALGLDARVEVDAATGGEGHDERDRPCRPVLRGGAAGEREQGCERECGFDRGCRDRRLGHAGSSSAAPSRADGAGSRLTLSRWLSSLVGRRLA